jgi:hypothetical protein
VTGNRSFIVRFNIVARGGSIELRNFSISFFSLLFLSQGFGGEKLPAV